MKETRKQCEMVPSTVCKNSIVHFMVHSSPYSGPTSCFCTWAVLIAFVHTVANTDLKNLLQLCDYPSHANPRSACVVKGYSKVTQISHQLQHCAYRISMGLQPPLVLQQWLVLFVSGISNSCTHIQTMWQLPFISQKNFSR